MPECVLGNRCFSRDGELDPEKKPKVDEGSKICALCKNVSIDKLEERTIQEPVTDGFKACYEAEKLRGAFMAHAENTIQRRLDGEDDRFVCITKDPNYWGAPWELNDFDPQSSHKCLTVTSPGNMCLPCHERAQETYPQLKEKFKDGGQFIGFPCVWVDPEYEKEDAKIKPGWQNRSNLLEIYNVDTLQNESLEEWDIGGQRRHERMIAEGMLCQRCRMRIDHCDIKHCVFDQHTFKLNPTWENAVRSACLSAGVPSQRPKYARYLGGDEYFPEGTDDPNRTERKGSTHQSQYQEVNRSGVWGKHKVPMLEEEG